MKRPRSAIVSTSSIKTTDDCSADTPSIKKRSDSVFFSDNIRTIGTSDTTPEHVSDMWYVHKELEVFRKQARDHILGKSTDNETRGYERYNAIRSKQKALTRKVTLLACSQKGLSPEDVAIIVRKSSLWAVKDAFRAGCNDFCAVYCPEMALLMKKSNKRSVEAQEEQRNVRQRTIC
jgi:Pyruvate/2-oxoacid:ferredoxin oxidoreductase delta subunit